MSNKYYVAGFLFSEDREQVVLIQKTKPEWQAGRRNAIGGKIEPGELPVTAMRREFREEAGVDIPEEQWESFAFLEGSDWSCHFYRAFGDVTACSSQTEEPVETYFVETVKLMDRPTVIGNIPWLLPLALDMTGGVEIPVHIKYSPGFS